MSTPNPLVPHEGERWFTADAPWWRAVCARFDHVAGRLAAGQPSRTFAAAARLGRIAQRVHACGPRPEEVGAIFPAMTPRDRCRTARQIAAQRVRNRAAIALVHQGGLAHLEASVDEGAGTLQALAQLPQPTVLVTWHVGAMYGIGAALRRAGLSALILRGLPLDTSRDRTRALWQAIHHLRDGKIVVAMLDGPGGVSTAPVPCLGRRIVFRRGPFLLAKTTGAQLVPIVTSWERKQRIGVTLGDPLAAHVGDSRAEDSVEHAQAAEAGRWLERYLAGAPDQMWLYTLRNFLSAPHLDRTPPRESERG